jgi:hypothetical protein
VNSGIKMMSAMNMFLPFRTGVYPQPSDASWLAAGALLFAQLADAPIINLFRMNPPARVWIGLRVGI